MFAHCNDTLYMSCYKFNNIINTIIGNTHMELPPCRFRNFTHWRTMLIRKISSSIYRLGPNFPISCYGLVHCYARLHAILHAIILYLTATGFSFRITTSSHARPCDFKIVPVSRYRYYRTGPNRIQFTR